MTVLQRAVSRTLATLFACLLAVTAAAASYPFHDDFDHGLSAWVTDAPWALTTAYYSSPPSSVSDSPETQYGNLVDASLTLGSPLDLSLAERPVLVFHHRYAIEDGYDWGSVEVSTDGGASWVTVLATYTGLHPDWAREQLDLEDLAGLSNVLIRFRLVTDDSVVRDGWYIDDVTLAEAPISVGLSAPTAPTATSVELGWTESQDPDFLSYRIYRSLGDPLDWRSATLVGEITDQTTIHFTDISASPKSTYHYAVMVLTSRDTHSLSNEESVTTPPTLEYPFLDQVEGTGLDWTADPPWAITTETAFSGTHSWSDSPDGNYADGIVSQSLTLTNPLDLSAAGDPILSFVHQRDFEPGDYGIVEVSTDAGTTWNPIAYFPGTYPGLWRRERLDLASYAGEPSVLIRFRIETNASGNGDGWHLDDISLAESPTVVSSPVIDQETSRSLHLRWNRSVDSSFSWYGVFRDSSSSVGINSTLVGVVTDQDLPEFTDSGLQPNTYYYYRVFAVNPYGTFSPNSNDSGSGRTTAAPLPFFDDFEGSLEMWDLDGTWDSTGTDRHSGLRSLTDSPGGPYANYSNSSALLTLDLSTASLPILRFWNRTAVADQHDGVHVSVSENGYSWTTLYSTTDTQVGWNEQSVDLSEWKACSALKVRFQFVSDGSGTDDGWYLDDLSIQDESQPPASLPISDGAENGLGNWLAAGWTISNDSPHGGLACFRGKLIGTLTTSHNLEFARAIDLPSATDPVLAFSLRGTVGSDAELLVETSTDGGATWTPLPGSTVTSSNDPESQWARYFFSLAQFAGQSIRLRFKLRDSSSTYQDTEVYVDDVSLTNEQDTVELYEPVAGYSTVALNWSESSLGGSFGSYQVYRADHPGVSSVDTLVMSISDLTTTSWTDTGLEPGTTYYYRVFTLDQGQGIRPSNERSTTTSALTVPVSDPMENLNNWVTTGEWGLDSDHAHSGSFSLTDSPGHNYSSANTGTYAETVVNLTGTNWPVLRFWDRFTFVERYSRWWDRGAVEVSCDGEQWTPVYDAVGSRTYWSEQAVDLSQWKGCAALHVRFLIYVEQSCETEDGWHVDDLSIVDHAGAVGLPFLDSADSGIVNWLPEQWEATAPDPHGGNRSFVLAIPDTESYQPVYVMELAGELDLRAVQDPQLVYRVWDALDADCGYHTIVSAQVSSDGGMTWSSIVWNGSPGSTPTPIQGSLAGYQQAGIRLRFLITPYLYCGAMELHLDDIAIEAAPPAVSLAQPIPHLKSVDLSWSPSTLGPDFKRYEVYRSMEPGNLSNATLVYTAPLVSITSLTDRNLSIGGTYYYVVAAVNKRDVKSFSNEETAATVPLQLPVTDPMEDLHNWEATGNWGPDSYSPHGGSYSLSDSPGGSTPTSTASSITTAVDLSQSNWPVLRFWERASVPPTSDYSGDWAKVFVSTDGDRWSTVYSFQGGLFSWAEKAIDLSPWKGTPNLLIRFEISTDSSNVGNGWFIDDLSITDMQFPTATPPFSDGAESGLGNWLPLGWEVSENSPHSGSWCFQTPSPSILRTSAWLSMGLAAQLDLSELTNPIFGFWYRSGDITATLRAEVSIDGGVSWHVLPGTSVSSPGPSSDWVFVQASLADYRRAGVRIRLSSYKSTLSDATDAPFSVDDIIVAESPPVPSLHGPVAESPTSIRLSWDAVNEPDFAAYRLLRSDSTYSSATWDVVTTITDPAVTSYVDTGLQPLKRYYYRLELIETSGLLSQSDLASGMTDGVFWPFSDDFETNIPAWYFTGDWQRLPGSGVDGSTGLVDSPGDYQPSTDTWAVTGVDLHNTSWPVLSFRDRFQFAEGDFGTVEISINGSNYYSTYYSANGEQDSWAPHQIDLSPFRDQQMVWIRFRVQSNSDSLAGDGWHIDDVTIGENPLAGVLSPPLVEGGETGLTDWLSSGWVTTAADPAEGSACLVTPALGTRAANALLVLSLGKSLDLSAMNDPELFFRIRGDLPSGTYFIARVSTDGGLSWNTVQHIFSDGLSADWVPIRISLDHYRVQDLRVGFVLEGSVRGGQVFLDSISIADPEPTAPTLYSPLSHGNVSEPHPVLVVTNAVDYQTDPLFYEFHVFDDPELTHEVAGLPALAEGPERTEWTVPTELEPGTQYWWRCRASDSEGHTGPWMGTATFFLQVSNRPPTTPELVAPANGTQIEDLSAYLTWLISTDPDEADGDMVTGYRVQIDDDPTFNSPAVDSLLDASGGTKDAAVSVALGSLGGSGSMVLGTRYYWRVAALDDRGGVSPWSSGPAYFVYGSDPDAPSCTISSPGAGATVHTDPIPVTGTASDALSGVLSVEVSTDGGTSWTPAVGTQDWLFQWGAASSGDYLVSCRARDIAGNLGTPSTPIEVHADLARTVSFPESGSWVYEDTGTANVTISLDQPRTRPVTVEVTVVGGTATAGDDYTSPAQTITFAPGQTAAGFSVPIVADPYAEPNETVVLGLTNPSPSDVAVGPAGTFTLTIANDDSRADLDLDGEVTGNDMVVLILEEFDMDGTSTVDVAGSTNSGWSGYDLDSDGSVLASDISEEIKAMHE